MLQDLIIQPDDTTPIFQQLENQLLRFIRAGRLKPGEELPSVRAMASQLAVNPMTVSKTINRMVENGWLDRRRGRPTCVAERLPESKSALVDERLAAEVERVVSHCKQLNLGRDALIQIIHDAWPEEP